MEKLVTQLSSPGGDEGPVRDRGGTRIMEPSTRSASTEHEQRMELKLRRELGEQILGLLDDPRTEDILLNPDSSLWIKRMGEGFTRVGEMSPTQASVHSARLQPGEEQSSIIRTRSSRPSFLSTAAASRGSFRRWSAGRYLRSACARARSSP